MAQQTINIGTVANDGTGDTIRDGGDKINDNFTELYTDYMPKAGGTFSGDIVVPAEAYGSGWNGSNEAPTKNDVYDKIETLAAAGGTVSSQSGTSYTAVIGDANTYIRFTNGSAVSFTIPPNSSVAFPVGTVIEVEQAGAGALSFVAGSGVTLNSRASDLTLAGQYGVAFAKKVATDTWTINGDL